MEGRVGALLVGLNVPIRGPKCLFSRDSGTPGFPSRPTGPRPLYIHTALYVCTCSVRLHVTEALPWGYAMRLCHAC
jgi:hypothetical protein